MSVMGTGVAAGAAQAAHNAQQVARRRDQRANEPAEGSSRMREVFETHLRAVEEGDQGEAPTQLRINRDHRGDDGSAEREETLPQDQDAQTNDGIAAITDDDNDSRQLVSDDPSTRLLKRLTNEAPLYQHLDVQA